MVSPKQTKPQELVQLKRINKFQGIKRCCGSSCNNPFVTGSHSHGDGVMVEDEKGFYFMLHFLMILVNLILP